MTSEQNRISESKLRLALPIVQSSIVEVLLFVLLHYSVDGFLGGFPVRLFSPCPNDFSSLR